ncbi:MAG: CsgG/HfaB family protein [Candidatus Lernaella stagnicola]|nr:CsgG/HfaB family protein [Candidatus Lernaella stagnicola]
MNSWHVAAGKALVLVVAMMVAHAALFASPVQAGGKFSSTYESTIRSATRVLIADLVKKERYPRVVITKMQYRQEGAYGDKREAVFEKARKVDQQSLPDFQEVFERALVNSDKLMVVDRSRLQQALHELDLPRYEDFNPRMMDPQNASKLGKIVSATHLVEPTVTCDVVVNRMYGSTPVDYRVKWTVSLKAYDISRLVVVSRATREDSVSEKPSARISVGAQAEQKSLLGISALIVSAKVTGNNLGGLRAQAMTTFPVGDSYGECVLAHGKPVEKPFINQRLDASSTASGYARVTPTSAGLMGRSNDGAITPGCEKVIVHAAVFDENTKHVYAAGKWLCTKKGCEEVK